MHRLLDVFLVGLLRLFCDFLVRRRLEQHTRTADVDTTPKVHSGHTVLRDCRVPGDGAGGGEVNGDVTASSGVTSQRFIPVSQSEREAGNYFRIHKLSSPSQSSPSRLAFISRPVIDFPFHDK
ncbi:hypothetical protein K474DRAFT_1007919 [Panus rudis PR-1116 ss-1]|nr:hypothetical protein K474DRAFT_1007919 [Panus rudis PR-1116 ss-1]